MGRNQSPRQRDRRPLQSAPAAALLGARKSEARYWHWYDRIWSYAWKYFVDHRYGAWYRILTRDNRKISDEKSPAGKIDYYTIGGMLRSSERHTG
jgi:mannose/cellobiose epimerase-like protein (N-acyl-D-glucosamine 2-epimerase family)